VTGRELCFHFIGSQMGASISRGGEGHHQHSYPFDEPHGRHHPTSQDKDYPEEILVLRNEIRRKSTISLERRYVLLLYCPPGYPIRATADYISSRLNLPIEQEGNSSTADYYLRELLCNESYRNGWIICDYPATVADVGSLKRLLDSENGSLNILYFDVDGQVRLVLHPTLLFS
jgi:hypothetical protein